jgi:hypothetical protein
VSRIGLACAAVVALACTDPSSATLGTARSGLYGVVLAGPTKPVCTVDEPCQKPVRVTLVFSRLATGKEAARTRSTAEGRYRIALRAGYYAVRTVERIGIDRNIRPRCVHVRAGRFDRIAFRIDTGIR